ncbi:MAG: carboxymuconolactone decarboxylase family protein [Gammaproteobacteria bacterium]|nr:carboxymuconolactone decarboxylase family protein [Gammaproteobacteria bacterium]
MAFIETTTPAAAGPEVQAMYRQLQGKLDYLPNYAGVFCYRPRVMQAWAELQREIRAQLDDRTFSLITLASALEIGSSYCALAHGRKLSSGYFSSRELAAIIEDREDSPLSPSERAMMSLARKVARDASSVTQADIDALRGAGYSDATIFDIVATAAARCFFARIPDALGAQPDSALADMDEGLRAMLTVGRPIADD